MENLITVKTYVNLVDLGIPRSLLESEGIECFVQDEFITQAYPAAVLGIKLQVMEHDLERAIEILKEGGFLTDKDLESSDTGLDKFIGKFLDKFRKK